ncbi:hypothetical protein [Crocosphaera chwakensis]|uniref:Uncharacterized protein n=1 Tax=Crocosphaera chwakensis CCY0110 TaxID=391612 RepID=A3IY19_9CHRO|nr:hypothetical protein [Crocosphaera chwakensis]EAZ88595.1 hypothetical protein CY0110_31360 [Crocosphaera chwakensis CCY0110]
MSKVSEKVITVLSQEYEESHPLIMTVSVGIPATQYLMIGMICYSLALQGVKFLKKKKSPNSQN